MYKLNDWNENEKISLRKLNTTSCCIDTVNMTTGPCSNDIQTSCCIDTTKE